ncbi:MAG TPA: hypothetical protein VFG87_21405 [Amycolatopsis sp.]|nr:hypothetical protein [Amycolatopsis sp.]
MQVTGYAYSWNVVEEPGFADRVRELGVDEVAVAVSYHSTRAATPWSAERTAVPARHAALYRPVREEVWGRLRPGVPDWVRSPNSAGEAVAALDREGVSAAAWLVLTHDSRLGGRFPDVAVRNCFGESYPWALCPAHEEVREYAARLTGESLAGLAVSSVILEACGQLGAVHQCRHEKTDAVWSPAIARLLSVCCCAACAREWRLAGLEPAEVTRRLRAEISRLLATGDLAVTDDDLEFRDVLLATRQRATDALRRAVLDRIPPGTRVVLHGTVDPWATGALPGLTPSAPGEVDGVVLPCWQAGAPSIDAVATARLRLPATVEIGAYVTAVGANEIPDLESYVAELGKAGASALHLYHLGLAGPARWPAMADAMTGARAA